MPLIRRTHLHLRDVFRRKEITSLAPALVQVINNDDNIDVIVAAFNVFDAITLQRFRFPDSARLNDWWNANKDRYMKK